MKKENKYVIIWLLSGCLLLFMMVVVGGITRLTNSGLSMTDWHLVTDTFPPLTEAKWLQAFEEYKIKKDNIVAMLGIGSGLVSIMLGVKWK